MVASHYSYRGAAIVVLMVVGVVSGVAHGERAAWQGERGSASRPPSLGGAKVRMVTHEMGISPWRMAHDFIGRDFVVYDAEEPSR